jgi:hypothetical protein
LLSWSLRKVRTGWSERFSRDPRCFGWRMGQSEGRRRRGDDPSLIGPNLDTPGKDGRGKFPVQPPLPL